MASAKMYICQIRGLESLLYPETWGAVEECNQARELFLDQNNIALITTKGINHQMQRNKRRGN
jgi:hypothetical protein